MTQRCARRSAAFCARQDTDAPPSIPRRCFSPPAALSEIDCILLDIRMPGMSGLDLHLALTRMNHPAPVIYVTATHDGGLRERALSQGAAAFLAKTFEDEDLLNVIRLVVNGLGRDRA